MGYIQRWDTHTEGTHTDTWSRDTHGNRIHIKMKYIRRGDIHKEGTYTEKRHIRRRNIHGHMEWGHTRTHGVEIHTERGHIWSENTYGEGIHTDTWSWDTHGDGIYTERGHRGQMEKGHTRWGYTRRGNI